MIMVSAASLGTSNVDVATYNVSITDGKYMEEYNEVYRDAGKTASIKMTVTYNVTVDTQGDVDFYLQVVD
jgi:vacuolar-type H+-ATPase catalytic subunit A/Vma1